MSYSHGSVAAKAREHKEANPSAYCAVPHCLWRLTDRNGVVVSTCRNHPTSSPGRLGWPIAAAIAANKLSVEPTTDDTLLDALQRSVEATRKVDA